MFGTLEILDHSFKLNTILNSTATLFTKLVLHVVKNYVSEYVRNVRAEHEDPNKQLEPAKHIKYFPDHQFKWRLLTRASKYMRKRKILKAFFN